MPHMQLAIFVFQLLPFSALSYDIPSWLGFVFILHFIHVMHFISCHHVHRICIRVRLMHPSIFPFVRFAFRHSYVLRRPLLPLFECGC